MKTKSQELREERTGLLSTARSIVDGAMSAGRDLTTDESATVESSIKRVDEIDSTLEKSAKSADLVARISGNAAGTDGTLQSRKAAWAAEVASRVTETVGSYGVKAITTGGIDIPQVLSGVTTSPVLQAGRVLDLLATTPLTGNEFEYLRQTARTNNADVVADNATKPTSVYTFEDETGRARVFAHLSEAIPQRYLADHEEIANILSTQMGEDLYRALEEDVLAGDGTGEHFTGIANTSGVLTQAYSTDVLTTLRKARTALETAAETPTAWVMNYADLEAIDLTREGGSTGGFMEGIDAKIFGNLPRVASANVPAGFAYLGDWRQARLYVREQGRLDADMSGVLFEKNQVKLRYEGRFGFAVLRPSAFIKVDLTSA